uniref:Uncharacterized protein n=1 Tax=Romanomermis culicivorax TaxID=13658 RepID=A0A915IH91_ROMCU
MESPALAISNEPFGPCLSRILAPGFTMTLASHLAPDLPQDLASSLPQLWSICPVVAHGDDIADRDH